MFLARVMSAKYPRSKVRAALPQGWDSILDELLHAQSGEEWDQQQYHHSIMDALIDTGSGDSFIEALAALIKRLAVDRLHVVGDIFDRGPRADTVMDILMNHHSIDIEWGNHDALWMGAAAGSRVCIAGVLRNSLSYNNTEILERGYGIPLGMLMLYAGKLYPELQPEKAGLKAITTIMFKLEGQLIRRNPDFGMEDRLLLDKVDPEKCTVKADGREWPLKELNLPTVNWQDPYALTPEEEQVMSGLRTAFLQSIRLRQHITFLYSRGWLYRCYNGNLLFHGCIPLAEDGSFLTKTFGGKEYAGKALMDYADQRARRAFYFGRQEDLDFMWYLWCGTESPLCGRNIKTFARAMVADEEAWQEPRNPYYEYCQTAEKCQEILNEFGLPGEESRIINGHTPIRVTHGESPLKAGGKLIVIDGGFCRAYQKTTGIAGYTLIANSHGMRLMSHQPFTSRRDALNTDRDIMSQSFQFAVYPERRLVRDTDNGRRLQERMEDLRALLQACRDGRITLQK